MKAWLNKLKQMSNFAFLSNSMVNLVIRIVGLGAGYLSSLIIARSYGALAYGQLTLCITIMTVLSIGAILGFNIGMTKIVGELFSKENYQGIIKSYHKVFVLTFFVSSLVALLVFSMSSEIAMLFNKPNLAPLLHQFSIALIAMVIIYLISATLQGMHYIKLFTFVNIVCQQLLLLTLLILNHYVFKTDLVSLYVMGYGLTMIISLTLLYKVFAKFDKKIEAVTSYSLFEMCKTSLPMFITSSVDVLMNVIDVLVLGFFVKDIANVAIFNISQQVSGLLLIPLVAINSVLAPKVINYYSKKDFSSLRKIINDSTKVIFCLAFPGFLCCLLFPKWILHFWGPNFQAGAHVLMICAVGQLFSASCGSVGTVLNMIGKQKIYSMIISTAFIINIILDILLIPRYGGEGAAVATVVGLVFCNTAGVIVIKRTLGFWTFYIPFLRRQDNIEKLIERNNDSKAI